MRFGRQNIVGLHVPSLQKSFVKNQIPRNFRHIGQVEHGTRETAKIIVHELNHQGSEGGFEFSQVLDEGITERNTVDIISGKIHAVLTGKTLFNEETDAMSVWDSIVKSSDAAAKDIQLAYWNGSDTEGIQTVINAFGRKALSLLRKKDLTLAEWQRTCNC